MKKFIIVLVLLLTLGGVGFIFKDKIIGLIGKDKVEGLSVSSFDVKDLDSMDAFLALQKEQLEKKDYKNFVNSINQQLTSMLNDVDSVVSGFASLDNVLFVDGEDSKSIDFINMNMYDERLESSYTALTWVDGPNETNPTWTGYFEENYDLLTQIEDALAVEETEEEETEESDALEEAIEEEKELTLSEFQSMDEYNEIVSLLNEPVETEDAIIEQMKSTFGDNYSVVEQLILEAKQNVELDSKSNAFLGGSSYGVGYGGKVVDDYFYITTGPLKEDNTIGDTNYVLFRINTSGSYDDYSQGIIVLSILTENEGSASESSSTEESTEAVETDAESTEESTEVETTATPKTETETTAEETTEESEGEPSTGGSKKTPVDLFEEIMNKQAAETTAAEKEAE